MRNARALRVAIEAAHVRLLRAERRVSAVKLCFVLVRYTRRQARQLSTGSSVPFRSGGLSRTTLDPRKRTTLRAAVPVIVLGDFRSAIGVFLRRFVGTSSATCGL